MVCHGVLACKPGGGLVKLVANQGVGRGWIGGGSGKSLTMQRLQQKYKFRYKVKHVMNRMTAKGSFVFVSWWTCVSAHGNIAIH